jgi:hypothetical protein
MRKPKPQNLYGLCNGPQSGTDASPLDPVPVTAGRCEDYQQYTSTGPSATSFSCGGYTVAFAPAGNLQPKLYRVNLQADWGDTPLTQTQCAKARIAAVAWGARCANERCRPEATKWEKIGAGPKQRSGKWNSISNVCYIGVNFVSADESKMYRALHVDIIATLEEGGQTVRKLAKGTIYAARPNGKCLSSPAQAVSK